MEKKKRIKLAINLILMDKIEKNIQLQKDKKKSTWLNHKTHYSSHKIVIIHRKKIKKKSRNYFLTNQIFKDKIKKKTKKQQPKST